MFRNCVNGVKDDRMAGRKEKIKGFFTDQLQCQGQEVLSEQVDTLLYCHSTILLTLVSKQKRKCGDL